MDIYQTLIAAGAEIYLVGGTVRDQLLNRKPKDIDIVIRNLTLDEIITILTPLGAVQQVGKSFGIIKFTSQETGEIDIALPRTETTHGPKHHSIKTNSDPHLPIETDLYRRDFTINSIAININTNEIIDPYHGQSDLHSRIIRMTNPDAFSDDPLRILRCIQLSIRLNMSIDPNTFTQIKENAHKIQHLSRERIKIELDKISNTHMNIQKTLNLLTQSNVWPNIFPNPVPNNILHEPITNKEFWAILLSTHPDPITFFMNSMAGDTETARFIQCMSLLHTHQNVHDIRKTLLKIINIEPEFLNSQLLPNTFKKELEYILSNNLPMTKKELPVNGNDLIKLNYKGQIIGTILDTILEQITVYTNTLANTKTDILEFIKNKFPN